MISLPVIVRTVGKVCNHSKKKNCYDPFHTI